MLRKRNWPVESQPGNPAASLDKNPGWGLGGCDTPTSPNLENGTFVVHDHPDSLVSLLGAQPGNTSNLAIRTLPPTWQEASPHCLAKDAARQPATREDVWSQQPGNPQEPSNLGQPGNSATWRALQAARLDFFHAAIVVILFVYAVYSLYIYIYIYCTNSAFCL